MPPQPPPKGANKPAQAVQPAASASRRNLPQPPLAPLPSHAGEMPLGVAVSADSGTVTARKAGGLRDMGLDVDLNGSDYPRRSSTWPKPSISRFRPTTAKIIWKPFTRPRWSVAVRS